MAVNRTSKYVLAEQVIRILKGGTPNDDVNIDVREVAMYIEQAFSNIVRSRLFSDKHSDVEWLNGSYLYTFKNVEVVKDDDLDMYYSLLPATAIDLPNDTGVQYVGYMKNQKEAIRPVPPNFQSLFSGLAAFNLEGAAGYYVEGNKIYYVNWDGALDACKVLIKMMVSASSDEESHAFAIDECNFTSIPLDMQEEIIRRTVEIYRIEVSVPKDITNDNVDG